MPPKPHEYRYIEKFGSGKVPMCGCNRHKCKQCGYRFTKEDKGRKDCPDCNKERYCERPRIKDPNHPDKWLPCNIHGGQSHVMRGAASPHWKGGKYSKHLPARLLEAYDASREDADILSLNDDIALTEARVTDVLARVDSNESGALWDDLAKAAKEFKAAQRSNDSELCSALLEDLLKLIQKGKGDRENWREIGDLLERKRKLSESQLKLLTTKQEFISRQQAVQMVSQITEVIKGAVDDPVAKRKIISGIQQLMSMPDGQSVNQTAGLRDVFE